MAIVDLTRENLAYHKEAFQRLTPDAQRQWGELTPARLCSHVRYVVEVSLGDHDVEVVTPRALHTPLKIAFFHIFTAWPRGKLKAPADFTPDTGKSLDEERAMLFDTLDRFVDELEKDPQRKTASPLLGPQTLQFWAHAHGVHHRHHLRQYGLV